MHSAPRSRTPFTGFLGSVHHARTMKAFCLVFVLYAWSPARLQMAAGSKDELMDDLVVFESAASTCVCASVRVCVCVG